MHPPSQILLVVGLCGLCGSGCAGSAQGPRLEKFLLPALPPADGKVALVSHTYESIVRFDLSEDRPQKLRSLGLRIAARGKIQITIYDSKAVDYPGDVVFTVTREVTEAQVGAADADLWLIEDLSSVPAWRGRLWLGVKKVEGEPSLWACPVDSGRAFVRNSNLLAPVSLLPVRRTPLVRLNLAP